MALLRCFVDGGSATGVLITDKCLRNDAVMISAYADLMTVYVHKCTQSKLGHRENQISSQGVKTGHYSHPKKNILRTWNKRGTRFPSAAESNLSSPVCPASESPP
jgi:hypothetical protein